MEDVHKRKNISDHLANERTLLAWVRTNIGIMAFGFVVVKFSLFVKQLALALGKEPAPVHQGGYSSLIGTTLVAVGTITSILSYIRYKKTEKQINEDTYRNSTIFITALVAFIFFASILLIGYLIKTT